SPKTSGSRITTPSISVSITFIACSLLESFAFFRVRLCIRARLPRIGRLPADAASRSACLSLQFVDHLQQVLAVLVLEHRLGQRTHLLLGDPAVAVGDALQTG